MSLRIAKNEDIERVVEIYNSAIPWRLSTADTSPVSIESKRAWFDSHSECRPLYVYELEGNVIAWASIRDYKERPAYHATVELSIYIDHSHIGKGLGSEILPECISRCREFGVKNIIANIYTHNEASVRLCKKFGFEQWGELPEVCEMDGKMYSVSIFGLKL